MAAYNERMISVRRYSDARKQLNPEQQKMVSRLGELLTEMEASWGVSTESNITRLPDRGLRGLYLRSRLTPGRLADWFGTAVYRSGPHAGAKYDFKNKRDFGHYSPAFLASVRKWFDFLIGNNVTKPMLQGLYDNQLMDIASAYYRMYQYLYAPENQQWAGDLLDRYQRSLQGEGGLFKEGYGYPYHEMREVARRLEKREGLNVHELTTAGAFWLRRRMDGSERAVAEILVQLLDGLEPISGPTR
jgi:hypothetical protein